MDIFTGFMEWKIFEAIYKMVVYINRVEGKLGVGSHEQQSEVSAVPSNPIYSEVVYVCKP